MVTLSVQKGRSDALDGWRTIAVTLVVLHHLVNFSALSLRFPAGVRAGSDFGGVGVFIFFVISGYVICSVLRNEYSSCGRICLSAFYIRRCFRILPPLWGYLLVIATANRLGMLGAQPIQIGRAGLFACNFINANCSWYVAHTWSLAYEEQFYILFPIIFLALWPRRRTIFLAFFIANAVLILILYQLKQPLLAHYFTMIQFPLTGVVMAVFSHEVGKYLAFIPPWTVYLSIVGMFILYALPASRPVTLVRVFALPPLTGLIVFYTSHFVCSAKSILSRQPLPYVGRISYGIYLWQQLATADRPGAGWSFYIFALALTLVISAVSFRYFEGPLIRTASGLSQRLIAKGVRRTAAAAA